MSKRQEVGNFVGKKLHLLQAGISVGNGEKENAVLAKLRRGVGKEPGEMPQLFGIVLQDMPESFLSKKGIATKEEWACYTALTLYALHQQGYQSETQSMHTEEKVSMGKALARLAATYEDSNAEQRMLQRLQKLATAGEKKELAYHIRGVVQLLRSSGITLNYVLLAEDLYDLQDLDRKNRVCLRWGQDFYRREMKEKKEQEEQGGSKK